jgi:hypothetical protein
MMTTLPSAVTEGVRRRIVLIDFDWQDADLLPRLLQQPGVLVRLVAGERTEDAGLRMAEICGLPRTLDLADLTREIFDLALLSSRSLRLARVQSLLEALRTPCLSPREFLESEEKPAGKLPAPQAAAVDSVPRVVPPVSAPPTRSAPAAQETPARGAVAPADIAPPAGAPADIAPPAAPAGGAPAAAAKPDAAPGLTSPGAATPDAPAPEPVSPQAVSSELAPAEPSRGAHAAPVPSTDARGESGARDSSRVAPAAPAEARAGGSPPGEDFDTVVEQALGGMAKVTTTVRSKERKTDARRVLQNLQNFPSKEDRASLEAALQQMVANTGAVSAELHAGRASGIELVAQVGAHDPLLEGMVGLAFQLNSPQIIRGLSSPHEGKLWGAWPFRTIQHRGVLAASAIDPQGGVSPWEKMVDEMRERWDQQDREGAVQSFPLLPGQERAWLERADFRARLELAVERNKFDGLPFSLHRLEFPGPEIAANRMCEGLPQLLRGSDYLCHLPPRHVLLLTAVPADDYTHVRRRLLAAWEQAWRECGQTPPAPPIADLRAEMAGPEDAEGFLATAEGWISPSS